ncbi:PRD domain-containing protein [Lacticaseibacillus daqingensis]|uniref:PRD domain-containing protein n=1 Tax=Lacticaseibacillus daqingensis TaxID=2486014 RepID=UPI000F794962|nr:PRD domain-containing protein [Lacticaseibacillus daqingensis]
MKYVKNFNNNAALVVDGHQTEWIVLGNGVGFGHRPGDEIEPAHVTRYFKADEAERAQLDALGGFSAAITDATLKVVAAVEAQLKVHFTDYQYLILADHIDFAVRRARAGIALSDPASKWELRKLFPAAYAAAQTALGLLTGELGCDFADDEATFLTYHFVNVESERERLQDTIAIAQLMTSVIRIVQLQYSMTLDAESFNYSRFVSHLRYFLIRKLKAEAEPSQPLDPSFLQLMARKYPREVAAVDTIVKYLHKARGWEVSANDRVYLTLHIWRVTHRDQVE